MGCSMGRVCLLILKLDRFVNRGQHQGDDYRGQSHQQPEDIDPALTDQQEYDGQQRKKPQQLPGGEKGLGSA